MAKENIEQSLLELAHKLDAMPSPDYVVVDGQMYKLFNECMAHHKKWMEQLFTLGGLLFLFPNLK